MSNDRDHDDLAALREAALVLLLDEEDEGSVDLDGVREVIGASEWRRINEDLRFWALGHCAGDAAHYEAAAKFVQSGWLDLPDEVRAALRARVLDWVRPRLDDGAGVAEAPQAVAEPNGFTHADEPAPIETIVDGSESARKAWTLDEDAQDKETQTASDGTGPSAWDEAMNIM